uniref:NTP_transf_2 domain-containing protein n=1 Tax=Meloidogyne hapla TaxID=6305 RepID=A0A1I8BCN5_MELHA
MDKKIRICTEIENLLNKFWTKCNVAIFGSTIALTALSNSDLDLTVYKFNEDGKTDQEDLTLTSKVPCTKFRLLNQKIDISMGGPEKLGGLLNGIWLNTLNKIDPLFRKMSILVKNWAREINDATKGGINSVSLIMFIETFLIQKKLLPNLFKLKPEVYEGNNIKNYLHTNLQKVIIEEMKTRKIY